MTQLIDNRGLAMTVASQTVVDNFESALSQMLTYSGDSVGTIDKAIAEDPEFVMGHCLRAHAGGVMVDAAFCDQVRESVAHAEALAGKANDRERKHIAAARKWLDGNFNQAAELLESVLVDYPRDTLALLIAHLGDFYRGDAHNLRDRVARVLPQYSEDDAEYGYVLGMYAFGLEECNEYSIAEETGRKAVEMNAADVWATHAVAHVMEMQGRQDDGINWYESRVSDWSSDSGFAVHNWWHLALFYLDLYRTDKVLEIYDNTIFDGIVALEMLDASALLWRLHLMGIDTGNRWQVLSDKWAETIEKAGYYCFNDVHAILAFVGSGRLDLADRMVSQLRCSASNTNDSGGMIRNVGLPIGEAIVAFGKGDYGVCTDLLCKIRYIANQFGGSHAQRDFIPQTLIESAARAGRLNQARSLLSERAARKPTSPHIWQKTASVLEQLQCVDEAQRARRRAESLLASSRMSAD
ncbi:MAG: tetratricopeptide repeat protein [Acidiferrobacterales bacterium]|nr:tetratricopeptide repeat protein [Acidiferrobacterales bacterium]